MANLLNVRVLASLGMIVFVAAVLVSSTGAFFSDTETSTGNTFTAGELDLTIDNSSYGFDWNDPTNENPTGVWGPNTANSWTLRDLDTCGEGEDETCLFFSFADLKPGDYGEDTISLHVQNNAYACMRFDLGNTPDNGINNPEEEAGDVSDGDAGGELQNYLSFMFWNDDGDNVLEEGEDVIEELSGLPGTIFSGDWLPIAEGGDLPLQAGTTTYIGKGWCFGAIAAAPIAQDGVNTNPPTAERTGFTCDGSGDHNVAQTDGIVVDVEFMAVQSRNNDDFQCPNDEQEVTPGTVTLDKIVTFTDAPLEGVDPSDYTLHLVGPGGDHVLVDQIAFPGLTPGAYVVSEVYTGPANATSTAAFSGSCTEIGTTDTATLNVVSGVNPVCTITNSVTLAPAQ